jgi:hypothetical protein
VKRIFAASLLLAACSTAPPAPEAPSRPDPIPFPLPYAELEAESARTDGVVSERSTALYDVAAEASGRRFVTLNHGQRLVLTLPTDADSVVVRFSLPSGKPASLDLEGTALHLTPRFQGVYGQPKWGSANVWRDPPGRGLQRHFWDEVSARVPLLKAGAEAALVNTSSEPVLVDFVDFEKVPAALQAPPGSLSFADFHPDATGTKDVTDLLQKALDQAKGRPVYIPEGVYRIDAVFLPAVTVQGAGLWRTRFVGPACQFRFAGKTAHLTDLALFGETTTRNDTSDEENAFSGAPGPDSSVERVWVEHKKCAFWVGNWGSKSPVTGLTIVDCRFRDTMADGVNLCSGTTGSTIRGCLVRNTGDDGLAAWSPRAGGPAGGGNVMEGNVVQLPWLASGIALYGGGPFTVSGNLVKDTVTTGSGIFIAASFNAWPFQGAVDVKNNVLVRCGAHESDPGGPTGAIRVLGGDAPLTGAALTFTSNTIVDPLESAVSFQGPQPLGALTFHGLVVNGMSEGTRVVDIRGDASGSAVFTDLNDEAAQGPWRNLAGADFTVTREGPAN